MSRTIGVDLEQRLGYPPTSARCSFPNLNVLSTCSLQKAPRVSEPTSRRVAVPSIEYEVLDGRTHVLLVHSLFNGLLYCSLALQFG